MKYTIIDRLKDAFEITVLVLRVLLMAFSILVIIYGASISITSFNGQIGLSDKNHGHFMGYRIGLGKGRSMVPTLNSRLNLYILKKVDTEDIKVGDVIEFKVLEELEDGTYEDLLVSHRVMEIVEDGFITKGDGNTYYDDWVVNPENVYGVIEYSVQKGKLINLDDLTPREILLYLEEK